MTASISPVDDQMVLVIRPEHRGWKALLRAAILAYIVREVPPVIGAVVAEPPRDLGPRLFVLVVLMLGVAFVALMTLSFLWMLFGAQIVSIQGDRLSVDRALGPVPLGRPKEFDVAHVHDMRIEERHYRVRGRPAVERSITFEYLGERRRLLRHLSAERASSLMDGPLGRFAGAGG